MSFIINLVKHKEVDASANENLYVPLVNLVDPSHSFFFPSDFDIIDPYFNR